MPTIQNTMTPQTLLLRLFFAGILCPIIFAAIFTGTLKLLANSSLMDGMLALAFSLPVLIMSFTLATIGTISFTHLLLPASFGINRLYIAIFGTVAALEVFALIRFALAPEGIIQPVIITALITGIIFTVFGYFVTKLPRPGTFGAMIIVVTVLGVATFWHHQAGHTRRNVNSLEKLDFTLYIPRQTSEVPKTLYVAPMSDLPGNNQNGVYFALDQYNPRHNDKHMLFETKHDGSEPASDCSNGYTTETVISTVASYHSDTFTCTLVTETNGIKIYYREKIQAETDVKEQRYFAIVGNTLVWTTYFDVVRQVSSGKPASSRLGYTDGTIAPKGRLILENLSALYPNDYGDYAGRP